MALILSLGIALALCATAAMLPVRAVRLLIGTLLSADTTWFTPDDANIMLPIVANFVQSETLVIGDLTLGTDHGLGDIAVPKTPLAPVDPSTDAQKLTLTNGAIVNNFQWVTSGSFPPNITVYGFALVNNDKSVLIATEKLTNPIVLTGAGQVVEFSPADINFVQQPMS